MDRMKERQDELMAIVLDARRRELKPRPPVGAGAAGASHRSVPSPAEDLWSDFVRSLSPEQRDLLRRYLEAQVD